MQYPRAARLIRLEFVANAGINKTEYRRRSAVSPRMDIEIDKREPHRRLRRILHAIGPRILPLITGLSAASALGVAALHLIGRM
jgi:hypothetical protein